MLKTDKKCKENKFKKFSKKIKNLLYFFFCIEYNMTVIKRNAQRFRLVTFYSSSFSPLSYMDQAQNRKALRLIHFLNFLFAEASGAEAAGARHAAFGIFETYIGKRGAFRIRRNTVTRCRKAVRSDAAEIKTGPHRAEGGVHKDKKSAQNSRWDRRGCFARLHVCRKIRIRNPFCPTDNRW